MTSDWHEGRQAVGMVICPAATGGLTETRGLAVILGAVAAVLFVAAPAMAAKQPVLLPPLPPLILAAEAPIVTVTLAGVPLRLRVDPGATRYVEVNAEAAARLGLADPARRVAGKPAVLGHSSTEVGKVNVMAVTSEAVLQYEGRDVPLVLAWSQHSPVAGADGLIGPFMLPHDVVQLVRRPVVAGDRMTHVPMRWDANRGLLGSLPSGGGVVDVLITPATAETIATAAAASLLATQHGGRLTGPAREAMVSLGVSRPVRDVVFAAPVDVAGVRLQRVAARVFDWSGNTNIPDADIGPDEALVAGRADNQRAWAKLAIGNDVLKACAQIVWTRLPLAVDLVCPAP